MPIYKSTAPANCDAEPYADTIGAVDAHDIRRANLALLVERIGSQAKLAALLEIEPSLISQYKTGVRDIGERFARGLERRLNLPRGAMDRVGLEAGVTEDLATLEAIIAEAFEAALAAGGYKSGKAFGRFCVAMYRVYLETGDVPVLAQALRLGALLDAGD